MLVSRVRLTASDTQIIMQYHKIIRTGCINYPLARRKGIMRFILQVHQEDLGLYFDLGKKPDYVTLLKFNAHAMLEIVLTGIIVVV